MITIVICDNKHIMIINDASRVSLVKNDCNMFVIQVTDKSTCTQWKRAHCLVLKMVDPFPGTGFTTQQANDPNSL